MVIKWKKRDSIAVLAYVAALSLFLTGMVGMLRRGRFYDYSENDFQETKQFREYIASRLEDFLSMACGDYVSGSGYYYEESTAASSDVVEEAIAQGTYELAVQEEEIGRSLSEKEKKASADALYKRIQRDKNLLYRVSYRGKTRYTNMNTISWQDPKSKDLPEGYNFSFYFDGEKATIRKDGKEVNAYGDGIYREDADWRIPGYKNYTGKVKWGEAEVFILAAKEPIEYLEYNAEDGGYWTEYGLYDIYREHKEQREQFRIAAACFVAGLILMVCYLCLRTEGESGSHKKRGMAGKWFAARTGKIWFEWKALLFCILPVFLFVYLFCQSDAFFLWRDYTAEFYYDGVPAAYASEMSMYFFDAMASHKAVGLAAFWLLHLFVSDVCHNRGSYKNGGFAKLAAAMESKSLTFPLSKRIVRRSYGILFLTIAQMFFFITILAVVLAFKDRLDWVWIVGPLVGSLMLTAALLAVEAVYQKNNRVFAADLEKLSWQIFEIRDGNYEGGKTVSAQDADIRHMAAGLEDIRKGLETAVEERMGSERMKVELVANVSHDIKTPLTSIISYIQLLKQEEGLPEHIRDYIGILDQKSERLNCMVQDVFAVSKAASGQLSVKLEKLDLGKLLQQTLADMQETVAGSPVTIKTEIPGEPVFVQSDGSRMYRVFQNLIENALKYSLEGSRVYITLQKEGNNAAASVKNTSSRELNQNMDFAERFVRGDESRTDGGSGLGLSIAKSFTEACGGSFRLETIADLFVVTVYLTLA